MVERRIVGAEMLHHADALDVALQDWHERGGNVSEPLSICALA